jgi:hypothetical protein
MLIITTALTILFVSLLILPSGSRLS